MPDVYLPLLYTPINPNKEPRVLFKLGSIYQELELGKKYQLRNPVSIFANTYFTVMVTGFYQGLALVQCPESSDVLNKVTEHFFLLHNRQDYKLLSQEEYYLLYPEESLLIPPRLIGIGLT